MSVCTLLQCLPFSWTEELLDTWYCLSGSEWCTTVTAGLQPEPAMGFLWSSHACGGHVLYSLWSFNSFFKDVDPGAWCCGGRWSSHCVQAGNLPLLFLTDPLTTPSPLATGWPWPFLWTYLSNRTNKYSSSSALLQRLSPSWSVSPLFMY